MTSRPNRIIQWFSLALFIISQADTSHLRIHKEMLGVSFGDSLFVSNAKPLPWLKAGHRCKKDGGTLAILKNETLNTFIFDAFFRHLVLTTPHYKREEDFSSVRNNPPNRHRNSKHYHKHEAWVGGVTTMSLSGKKEWFWLGDESVGYSHFGTGYVEEENWNCMSVRPAIQQELYHNSDFANYSLFWYATDCLTYLPYICQYNLESPEITLDKLRFGSIENSAVPGLYYHYTMKNYSSLYNTMALSFLMLVYFVVI